MKNLTRLSSTLRTLGLRATPQRLAIAERLFNRPCHTTPQGLYEELKGHFPSLSVNTVYLTLGQFEESGLLRRIHIGGRTIFDSNISDHDHACCVSCGKILDVDGAPQEPTHPAQLRQWHIEGERRIWYGHCDRCTKRKRNQAD